MTNGGIVVEGLVKGELARGSAGKSAEADETTFFPPARSVRGFPLRRARPFFLCTRSCSCLKLSTVCLAYADRTFAIRV